MTSPDSRAWEAAARLILEPSRPEAITWTLIALRGQLTPPGHPVLALLEEHRAYLRGERSALSEAELAPLHARVAPSVPLAG